MKNGVGFLFSRPHSTPQPRPFNAVLSASFGFSMRCCLHRSTFQCGASGDVHFSLARISAEKLANIGERRVCHYNDAT
jgi:hypothetical protein